MRFDMLAQKTSLQCGRPAAFLLAVAVVLVWAGTGPVFHYSDTWQLVINTGTTVVTFLMVFLIQNTQNRDMAVLQLKLDELIRASANARNQMMRADELPIEDIDALKTTLREIE